MDIHVVVALNMMDVIKKEGIFQKDYSNLKISDIITIENNTQRLSCEVIDKKDI